MVDGTPYKFTPQNVYEALERLLTGEYVPARDRVMQEPAKHAEALSNLERYIIIANVLLVNTNSKSGIYKGKLQVPLTPERIASTVSDVTSQPATAEQVERDLAAITTAIKVPGFTGYELM